jgi:hypothetical protein
MDWATEPPHRTMGFGALDVGIVATWELTDRDFVPRIRRSLAREYKLGQSR